MREWRAQAMPSVTRHITGPAIHAVHPWAPGDSEKGARHQLFSEEERAQLAKIATVVRFDKGQQVYTERDAADAAFNLISGVVTACRKRGGAEPVTSFLSSGDLFGLSEEGR